MRICKIKIDLIGYIFAWECMKIIFDLIRLSFCIRMYKNKFRFNNGIFLHGNVLKYFLI